MAGTRTRQRSDAEILEGLEHAFLTVMADGTVDVCNGAASALLGEPAHMVRGRAFADVARLEAYGSSVEVVRREMSQHGRCKGRWGLRAGQHVEWIASAVRRAGKPTGEWVVELKAVQDSLDESSGWFAQALLEAPAAIMIHDMKGKWLYVNNHAAAMHGYTRDELMERGLGELLTPESRENITAWSAAINSRGEARLDVEHLCKDGTRIPLEVRVKLIQWNGNPAFLAICSSTLERKQAQQIIAENEERLRLVMEATREGVWDWDLTTNKAFFGDRYYTMLGYQPGEFPATYDAWRSMVAPEDLERVESSIQEHIRNRAPGYTVEFRLRTKDGSWKWVSGRGKVVQWDSQGKPTRMVGSHVDITARRQMEEDLRKSQQQHQLFLRNFIGIAFQVSVAKNQPEMLDGQVKEITGFTREEFFSRSKDWGELVHPDDMPQFREELQRLQEVPGYVADLEYRIIRKDGQVAWVRSMATRVQPAEDADALLVGTVHDVTEKKLAELPFQKLFENSPMGKVIVRWDGIHGLCLKAAYAAASRILNTDLSAHVGEPLLKVLPSLASTELPQRCQRAAVLGESWELNPWQHDFGRGTSVLLVQVFQLAGGQAILSFADVTEQHNIQRALQESEERFRSIGQAALDGILLADAEGRVVYFNPAAERIFGWEAKEVLGQPLHAMLAPAEHHGECTTKWEHFARTGHAGNVGKVVEVFGRHRDGHLVSLELAVSAVLTKEGWQGVAMVRDITARKNAERALTEKTRELDRFFESTLDLLCIADTNGHFRRTNRQWETTLGYATGELEGSRFLDLVHPDDLEATHQAITGLSQQQPILNFTNRYRRKDGTYRWIEWRSTPAGNLIYASARDITERKETEEALRTNEALIREIIDNAPFGAYTYELTTDNQLVFQGANASADRIIGIDHRALIGLTLEQAFPGLAQTEIPERYRDVVRTGKRWESDAVSYGEGPISGTYEVFAFRSGTRRMGVFFRDVKERKRAEEERKKLEAQLQHSQKMEAVGRLAGGVAHDFNNLLTGITGNVDLALLDVDPHDPLATTLQDIRKVAKSAAALTRQLLAFSRKQIVEPRIVDLNELVGGLKKMLVRVIGEDIEFQFRPGNALGAVKIDPGQFEQILLNMVVNARDAMPKGGRLIVETMNAEMEDGHCQLHSHVPPGPYVVLVVSDTGHGMSAEVQAHLFEPFFTTKPKGKGTGLGLATVYGAVQQAGGSITVYSEEGKGTTFRVYLPRVEDRAEKVTLHSTADDIPGGTETILLVEDEQVVRNLALRYLKRLGYNVLCAENGGAAFLLAEQHKDPIHLLLTDVVMPGLDGRQLADRVAQIHPETRVLYTSGYTEDVIVHHGVLEAGLDFLPKPYHPSTLAKKIRHVLGS